MKKNILVLGASGQIGTELVIKLREINDGIEVIASDIRTGSDEMVQGGRFLLLDVTDKNAIKEVVNKYAISTVYLMAAMLSVTAEQAPRKAWNLNINSLLNVLDLAKDGLIKNIFWPSSIAVFGTTTPKVNTPQKTIMEPTTVYGISKQAGERWCAYYKSRYNVDVRSVRYPGIISWKTKPGGGTTDYAVEIYHKAITEKQYECFLSENTKLPMMFMDDAIDATIQLMGFELPKLYISYNISGIEFTPKEIAENIQKYIPEFKVNYKPDFRQKIADSWPFNIDDSKARKDWNWHHQYNLDKMTRVMLKNLKTQYKSEL
jgi:nucleoside-diphosphate-sugar epimerase